jgi:hypothetical protein
MDYNGQKLNKNYLEIVWSLSYGRLETGRVPTESGSLGGRAKVDGDLWNTTVLDIEYAILYISTTRNSIRSKF